MHRKAVFTNLVVLSLLVFSFRDSTWNAQAHPLASPQTTLGPGFTYQGQLSRNGTPYNGRCDFIFGLYDSQSGATALGTQTVAGLDISGGIFTTRLGENNQFGPNPFDGAQRWLDVKVQCDGDATPVELGRQELSSTPYATYALSAGTVAGVVPIANGGPGSSTQNFIDLSSSQSIGGAKTFTSAPNFNASLVAPFTVSSSVKVANLNADQVDSYSAGNATGQIPVNNGLINTNLNAELLDGMHADNFQQHYQNVIVVAKSGGDFTSIQSAIDNISNASAENPYLIWVAPGIYSETITMKSYVNIQGAGEGTTKITSTGKGSTLLTADQSELSDLTVQHLGAGNTDSIAVDNDRSGNTRISHITAIASGGITYNIGINDLQGSSTLDNVTIMASGGQYAEGIQDINTTTSMTNVAITVTGDSTSAATIGMNITSSTIRINNVTVNVSGGDSPDNYGILSQSGCPSCALTLINSEISVTGGSGATNYGISIKETNWTMSGGGIAVSGDSSTNYGIQDTIANLYVYTAAIAGANITVSGRSSTNYGIYNDNFPSTLTNLSDSVSGGSFNYALYNHNTDETMQNSVLFASNNGTSEGIHNAATSGHYTIKVNSSSITGFSSSIDSESGIFNTDVGASQLIGGGIITNSGSMDTCVASYKADYTALTPDCQ